MVDTTIRPALGHAEQKVNVVLLAGGFSTRLVEDIVQKAAEDEFKRDISWSMLHHAANGQMHVPPGLLSTGEGRHMLAHVVNHLYNVYQCQPLAEHLFVITNGINHVEYAGVAGFFDDIGRFPRSWQLEHVICNQIEVVEDWKGDLWDASLAIKHVQMQNNYPILFIDANVFFTQEFNMQKMVSNMLIRGCTSIATRIVDGTDEKLYRWPLARVKFSATGQVPRIESIACNKPPIRGMFAARPIAFIATADFNSFSTGNSGSLLDGIVSLLESSVPAFAALIPWGCFMTGRLLPLRYVHGYMQHHLHALKTVRTLEKTKDSAADNVLALLQECDDVGLGKSRMIDSEHMASLLRGQVAQGAQDFERVFFAFEATKSSGVQLPAYKLPSTFYMTSYRDQVSDAMF